MEQSTWDGDQAMAGASEDDFQQFLDMSTMSNMTENMQFDFGGFHDNGSQPMVNTAQSRQQAGDMMEYRNTNNVPMSQRSSGLPSGSGDQLQSQMGSGQPTQNDSISNIDAQIQYLQRQKYQQQQRHMHEQQRAAFFSGGHHSVPPTPQSFEMPPGSGAYYSQAEQLPTGGVYDRGYQNGRDRTDLVFTPLVSPAVTPLDPHFNIENTFTVPGAYISPLTSPALHAQSDSGSGFGNGGHSQSSPVDMDLEMSQTGPAASSHDLAKKARKNNAAKTRSKGGIKSSPITKPQRKKTGPSPAIVSQVLNEIDEDKTPLAEPSMLPLPATSTEGSEDNASVSPENLNDMPPPPVPNRRSDSKSPYIQAQQNGQPQPSQAHPATPASLMKLPESSKQKAANARREAEPIDGISNNHIEALELPESVSSGNMTVVTATKPAHLPALDIAPASQTRNQPSLSPSASTPGVAGTASGRQSPWLQPNSSSSSSSTTKKTPLLVARNTKRRSSSVQVSPALLPRISPNIKPLLPGTPGMAPGDDATSRLLMSKSNYQNILEGNNVPGVSYPSELSTNLTSKRTSHKIAEQGRRNRINSALQEMAALLPDHHKSPEAEELEKKESKQGGNAPNSKASVVESAILHMKQLQQENHDLKQEVFELRKKLEGIKCE